MNTQPMPWIAVGVVLPIAGVIALAAGSSLAAPTTISAVVMTIITQAATLRLVARDRWPSERVVQATRTVVIIAVSGGLVSSATAWLLADRSSALLAAATAWLGASPLVLLLAPVLAGGAALARARRDGLEVTDPAAFERIGRADVVVLDKAGLVTLDQPRLAQRLCIDDTEADRILAMCAALEQHSDHPLGRAITRATPALALTATQVKAYPHAGLTGVVDGHTLVVGSPALLVAEGIDIQPLTEAYHFSVLSGQTAIGVAVDGAARGVLTFTDELRPGLREALTALSKMRLKIIVATGERDRTIKTRLQTLWVHEVRGHLDSQGKLDLLTKLEHEAHRPVFVTVGNDADLLAHPTTLSLGGGAAAVRTPSNDLNALVRCFELARKPVTRHRTLPRWVAGYHVLLAIAAAARLAAPLMGALAATVMTVIVAWSASAPWGRGNRGGT